MIAFEISRNGEVLAVVGTRDLIALHAVLMACGDLSDSSSDTTFFNMSAIGSGVVPGEKTTMHHTWSISPNEGEFEVGDTLSIRIIRTEYPTPPTTSEQLQDDDTDDEEAEQVVAPNGP